MEKMTLEEEREYNEFLLENVLKEGLEDSLDSWTNKMNKPSNSIDKWNRKLTQRKMNLNKDVKNAMGSVNKDSKKQIKMNKKEFKSGGQSALVSRALKIKSQYPKLALQVSGKISKLKKAVQDIPDDGADRRLARKGGGVERNKKVMIEFIDGLADKLAILANEAKKTADGDINLDGLKDMELALAALKKLDAMTNVKQINWTTSMQNMDRFIQQKLKLYVPVWGAFRVFFDMRSKKITDLPKDLQLEYRQFSNSLISEQKSFEDFRNRK